MWSKDCGSDRSGISEPCEDCGSSRLGVSEACEDGIDGAYYKTPSSFVHLVEVKSEDEQEPEKPAVAVVELAKMKRPISCKALLKAPNDQKPPPFIGGFIPNKQPANKVYTLDLSKLDVFFDEMMFQKAIDTLPGHKLPKSEELKGRQYCKWQKF
ncbi:hypothetical protein L3X38_024892 [Prunus dulcis]|uniref:Uncharacterized protein n=1 Tax=Prunus dulcis TaxID=3755 RepID=A0AAD4W293_PRUDU|nr:hypothetical protein L3X38_024892 [Prunus dulcis]